VKEPLVHRRHELAVLRQETVRSEEEERVVERPGPVRLPLVDADGAVDLELGACGRDPVGERPRDVDGVLPQPLPELIPAPERAGIVRPRARLVQRHEELREDRELHPVAGRFLQKTERLVHAGIRVEDHGRGLDSGYADGGKAHNAEHTPRVAAGQIGQHPRVKSIRIRKPDVD
jgi:hypothetical protein